MFPIHPRWTSPLSRKRKSFSKDAHDGKKYQMPLIIRNTFLNNLFYFLQKEIISHNRYIFSEFSCEDAKNAKDEERMFKLKLCALASWCDYFNIKLGVAKK
jgi:hypothetical protein